MKIAMTLTAALLAAACASAPAAEVPSPAKMAAQIIVVETEPGLRAASSVELADPKYANGIAAGGGVAIWVSVEKRAGLPAKVAFAGERVIYLLPTEVTSTAPMGSWDRPEPAFVGSMLRSADFKFLQRQVSCRNDQHWCVNRQDFVIELTPEMVRDFVRDGAGSKIPVSLVRKTKIDWRVPKAELVATLDALGVLGEFR